MWPARAPTAAAAPDNRRRAALEAAVADAVVRLRAGVTESAQGQQGQAVMQEVLTSLQAVLASPAAGLGGSAGSIQISAQDRKDTRLTDPRAGTGHPAPTGGPTGKVYDGWTTALAAAEVLPAKFANMSALFAHAEEQSNSNARDLALGASAHEDVDPMPGLSMVDAADTAGHAAAEHDRGMQHRPRSSWAIQETGSTLISDDDQEQDQEHDDAGARHDHGTEGAPLRGVGPASSLSSPCPRGPSSVTDYVDALLSSHAGVLMAAAGDELILELLPSPAQLEHQRTVHKFVAALVKRSLGAQVFLVGPHGYGLPWAGCGPSPAVHLTMAVCAGQARGWFKRLADGIFSYSATDNPTTASGEKASASVFAAEADDLLSSKDVTTAGTGAGGEVHRALNSFNGSAAGHVLASLMADAAGVTSPGRAVDLSSMSESDGLGLIGSFSDLSSGMSFGRASMAGELPGHSRTHSLPVMDHAARLSAAAMAAAGGAGLDIDGRPSAGVHRRAISDAATLLKSSHGDGLSEGTSVKNSQVGSVGKGKAAGRALQSTPVPGQGASAHRIAQSLRDGRGVPRCDVSQVTFHGGPQRSRTVSAVVDGLNISLSANDLHQLCTSALVGCIDENTSPQGSHLFKRSLVLLHAWVSAQAGDDGPASALSRLPWQAWLAALVWVFARRGCGSGPGSIASPWQALVLLLSDLAAVDWSTHALTAHGVAHKDIIVAASLRAMMHDAAAGMKAECGANGAADGFMAIGMAGQAPATVASGTAGGKDAGAHVRKSSSRGSQSFAERLRSSSSVGPDSRPATPAPDGSGATRAEPEPDPFYPYGQPEADSMPVDGHKTIRDSGSAAQPVRMPVSGRCNLLGLLPSHAQGSVLPGPVLQSLRKRISTHAADIPAVSCASKIVSPAARSARVPVPVAGPIQPHDGRPSVLPPSLVLSHADGSTAGQSGPRTSDVTDPSPRFPSVLLSTGSGLLHSDGKAADPSTALRGSHSALDSSFGHGHGHGLSIVDHGEHNDSVRDFFVIARAMNDNDASAAGVGTAPSHRDSARADHDTSRTSSSSPLIILDILSPFTNLASDSGITADEFSIAVRAGRDQVLQAMQTIQAQGSAGGIETAARPASVMVRSLMRYTGSTPASTDAASQGLHHGTTSAAVDARLHVLDGQPTSLLQAVEYCCFLLGSDLSAPSLLALATEILDDRGPLPVGEVGKFLQEATANPGLSSALKERFGGLKRFLESNPSFTVACDHPFNPHVYLTEQLTQEQIAMVQAGKPPVVVLAASRPEMLAVDGVHGGAGEGASSPTTDFTGTPTTARAGSLNTNGGAASAGRRTSLSSSNAASMSVSLTNGGRGSISGRGNAETRGAGPGHGQGKAGAKGKPGNRGEADGQSGLRGSSFGQSSLGHGQPGHGSNGGAGASPGSAGPQGMSGYAAVLQTDRQGHTHLNIPGLTPQMQAQLFAAASAAASSYVPNGLGKPQLPGHGVTGQGMTGQVGTTVAGHAKSLTEGDASRMASAAVPSHVPDAGFDRTYVTAFLPHWAPAAHTGHVNHMHGQGGLHGGTAGLGQSHGSAASKQWPGHASGPINGQSAQRGAGSPPWQLGVHGAQGVSPPPVPAGLNTGLSAGGTGHGYGMLSPHFGLAGVQSGPATADFPTARGNPAPEDRAFVDPAHHKRGSGQAQSADWHAFSAGGVLGLGAIMSHADVGLSGLGIAELPGKHGAQPGDRGVWQ